MYANNTNKNHSTKSKLIRLNFNYESSMSKLSNNAWIKADNLLETMDKSLSSKLSNDKKLTIDDLQSKHVESSNIKHTHASPHNLKTLNDGTATESRNLISYESLSVELTLTEDENNTSSITHVKTETPLYSLPHHINTATMKSHRFPNLVSALEAQSKPQLESPPLFQSLEEKDPLNAANPTNTL